MLEKVLMEPGGKAGGSTRTNYVQWVFLKESCPFLSGQTQAWPQGGVDDGGFQSEVRRTLGHQGGSSELKVGASERSQKDNS